MFLQLGLPPGVVGNGTDLQAAGRWRDASLVRWHEGAMRPVGGWLQRTLSGLIPNAPARGIHAWWDNSGGRHIVVGTHADAFRVLPTGVSENITPAGFTSGDSVSTVQTGYGVGPYGVGTYGTPRNSGSFSEATTWSFDNFGQLLLACSSADGRIWEYDPTAPGDLVQVTNAPTGCVGVIVTEGRYVVALAPGGDRRLVQWSDREDRNTWTPTATNDAGDFPLQTDGRIMCAVNVRGETLILTDRGAHTMSETSDGLIFSFEQVGNEGVISRRAAAAVGGGAYWMSDNGFYRYEGGDAEQIPCEVAERVFGDMTSSQRSLVHAVPNAQFNEVWWFYPSDGGSIINRYVAYNYVEGHWALGVFAVGREAGIDRGVFDTPLLGGSNNGLYNHETGSDHQGEAVYAESGPISPEGGENTFAAMELMPDEATQGDVTVTFKARYYPNGTETVHGPYEMANPTDLRFTGRQMRQRVEGKAGRDWRWGIPRIRTQLRGRR